MTEVWMSPPEDLMDHNFCMNILAIDYGQKNIGLAWMQIGLDVVLPYGILSEKDPSDHIIKLRDLIVQESIDTVVIGLPLTMEDGSENANTKRVRTFGAALEKEIGFSISYVDERLSSFEADQMGGDVSRDEKAAMVILQTYKEQLK
jgi:putative holliday junction resolvase